MIFMFFESFGFLRTNFCGQTSADKIRGETQSADKIRGETQSADKIRGETKSADKIRGGNPRPKIRLRTPESGRNGNDDLNMIFE